MTELTFEVATAADAAGLAALVNSAYRGESSRRGWTTEADLLGGQRTDEAEIRGIIASDDQVILRFQRAGALTACVLLKRKPDCAYLGMLSVKPDTQAAGIGRQVLAAAEAWAGRNWRVPRIEMTVIAVRRELVAWYLRRGYRDTGRTEAFPHHEGEKVGVPKVVDLTMMVLDKPISL
jgi:GNAT superfamily N-acetyltransferase